MNPNNFRKVESAFSAMGTDVSVEIIAGTGEIEKAEAAIKQVKGIFAKNEKTFSRFRGDSELSLLNKHLGRETAVSPEMQAVLELCLKFYRLSEGYFDPRIIGNLERSGYDKDFRRSDLNQPEAAEIKLEKIQGELKNDLVLNSEKATALIKRRIDTTGIAKGYTVDEAAEYLIRAGFKNFLVDAGGDMYAAGGAAGNSDWKIGIEGLDDSRIMLRLKDEGIATSGISRKHWTVGAKKFHHLVNPKDPGNFSFDIKTVTVIENKTVEADGRAKVLVLLGKEKGLEFANKNKLKALFLDYRGNVYLSAAIKYRVIKNSSIEK